MSDYYITVQLTRGRGTKVHLAKRGLQDFMTLCGWWGNAATDDVVDEIVTCKTCLKASAAQFKPKGGDER